MQLKHASAPYFVYVFTITFYKSRIGSRGMQNFPPKSITVQSQHRTASWTPQEPCQILEKQPSALLLAFQFGKAKWRVIKKRLFLIHNTNKLPSWQQGKKESSNFLQSVSNAI